MASRSVTSRAFLVTAIAFGVLRAASADTAPTTGPAAPASGVAKLIDQLSDPDPDVRNRATDDIQDLPAADLPNLEAAAKGDLPPEADARLQRVLPVIRQRVRLADRTARRNQALAEFYEREALAEFARGSRPNPKWDGPVRACIHEVMRRMTLAGDARLAADREAKRQYDAGIAAGCSDPTFLACAGLMLSDVGVPAAAVRDAFVRADRSAADGGAGPLFKLIIDGRLLRPAEALPIAQRRKDWHALMGRLSDMSIQFQRLMAVPGVPPVVAVATAENVYERTRGLQTSLTPFFECVMAPLEKAFPNDADVLALKGRADIDWAWEARGGGWANSVTPQGWKDFAARLEAANAALTSSWEQDKDGVDAPTLMLTVGLGQGWSRPDMDRWYRRAQAANPDDGRAAYAMLTYLEPKWHGDPVAMIKFGRDCLAGGDFRSEIPTTVAEAHWRVATNYAVNPGLYWLQPDVWEDLSTLYTAYIRRYPGNVFDHNQLARYATLCHQWKVADEQFKWLGDRADAKVFGNGSDAALSEARRNAALLADKPDEQGK